VSGRDAKRGFVHARDDLVADPVGTRSLEQHFEETVKAGTGKQHNADAQASPGIHAPVNGGHKEDIEDFIPKHGDDAHEALQNGAQRLQKKINYQFGLINNVHCSVVPSEYLKL